ARIETNRARFQVAMNHVERVCVVQRAGDLSRPRDDLLQWDCARATALEISTVEQREAQEQDHSRSSVDDELILPVVQNLADVRMAQLGGNFSLPFELFAVAGILSQRRRKQLHDHRFAEACVKRLVDRSLGAVTQHLLKKVALCDSTA